MNPSKEPTGLDNYQQRLSAWSFWNSQSTSYKVNNPEPPKPESSQS